MPYKTPEFSKHASCLTYHFLFGQSARANHIQTTSHGAPPHITIILDLHGVYPCRVTYQHHPLPRLYVCWHDICSIERSWFKTANQATPFELTPDNGDNTYDDNFISNVNSVDTKDPFAENFHSVDWRVFCYPSLCYCQEVVVFWLVFDWESNGKLIFAEQTELGTS